MSIRIFNEKSPLVIPTFPAFWLLVWRLTVVGCLGINGVKKPPLAAQANQKPLTIKPYPMKIQSENIGLSSTFTSASHSASGERVRYDGLHLLVRQLCSTFADL